MEKKLLVAGSYIEDEIFIIEVNKDLLDILEKCKSAYQGTCNIGLEGATLRIPIPDGIVCDFYKIQTLYKRQIDGRGIDINAGSLVYYLLPERERIELKQEGIHIDWNIITKSYDTIYINEDTIPEFSRCFTESSRSYMYFSNGVIEFESWMTNEKKMSICIDVKRLISELDRLANNR